MEFPQGYFRAEVRDDFIISEMMKRAWAAQLEVVEVFGEICDRHGIKYFATAGTLLGAVRHKGFIPWDDDTDLTMLREEYNELIPYLREELPAGFVISGMHGENKRLQEAGQTPQLRVMADEQYWSLPTYMNRFHGYPYPRIGIDVFPMDHIPKNRKLFDHMCDVYYAIYFTIQNWELYVKDGILYDRIKEIEHASGHKLPRGENLKNEMWLLLDETAQLGMDDSSGQVTNMMYGATCDKKERTYTGRLVEWYAKQIYLPFENTTMPVPCEYENVLVRSFGPDYMTPVKFAGDHDYPFYKKQEAEFRKMLDESGIDKSAEEFCRNWQIANGKE